MTAVARYPRATATQAYAGAAGTELVSAEQVAKLTTLCNECNCHPNRLAKTFGVKTLDQLPAAKFRRAIERIYHVRKLRTGKDMPNREKSDRMTEQDHFLRRVEEHEKAGMDSHEAWGFTLAEELAKGRPWRRELLKWVAESFLGMYEPKLKAWHQERVQEPALERAKIDWFAERLKARGVRSYRGKAEELYAQRENVTVHALRKRRQRRRKY